MHPPIGVRPSASRRPARRRTARGFTLAETMTVVVLIAIFAGLASPSFIRLMRERRVNRIAQEVSELYRLARMRALGRGSAVLVRFTDKGGKLGGPLYEVREAVVKDTLLPSSSCFATDWKNASTTSTAIAQLDTGSPKEGERVAGHIFFAGTTAASTYEICFSPRGRTYARAGEGIFTALTTPPSITVTNDTSGNVRTVFIPPSGVARLTL